MTHIPAPNPGSPRAVEMGCLCPVTDNHHGRGTPSADGRAWFVFSALCPLHSGGDWADTFRLQASTDRTSDTM